MNLKKSAGNNGPVFSLFNRKYLGSKRELAQRIREAIIATSGTPDSFFDGFTGTGAISAAMLVTGIKKLIVCDNLFSNTVILDGFFEAGTDHKKLFLQSIDRLNALPGKEGYITAHFADIYFTRPNCLVMDAIREEIESMRRRGNVPHTVIHSLLASFLLAADRVANTLGQYDAYLKHIDSRGYQNKKHVTDTRVHETFTLRALTFFPSLPHEIYTADILRIIDDVQADTAYFDPPYNWRQYCDNYHILENIARWEKPAVFGKTKKFKRDGLKSDFSSRRKAKNALETLLEKVKSPHVYISYNSEGIVAKTDITSMMSRYGAVKCFEFPYPVFGKGAGVSRRRLVNEYLFYVQKTSR